MDSGQGEIKKVSYTYQDTPFGFGNGGSIVVKNRAYRRTWKNRAMVEGRKSKKYYTQKKKGKKRK